eukprot:gene26875-33523_t
MTSNAASSKHVSDFLTLSGATVTKTSKYHDFITATAPVSVWEELMATEFFEFEHVKNKNVRVVRTLDYSLPEHLASHVSAVFNTVQFPEEFVFEKKLNLHTLPASKTARPHVVTSGATPSEVLISGYVTPALLNNFYNISSNTGNTLGSQCVYESLNQTYSPTDLSAFQNTFQLPLEPVAVDIGGHVSNGACTAKGGGFDNCGEANLDVQYMMAVSQTTPTTYWYVDDDNFMLDWVTTMAEMSDPPLVNSVSYSAYEISFDEAYATAFNTEAMKLAAMGVTLLSASGDDGVAGNAARTQPLMCGYYPQFPATSPYVTAVGGTMGPEAGTAEVACTSDNEGVITTGGGFSGLYPRPAWQNTVVENYFTSVSNTNNAPKTGYQTAGRGYPDVSLLAAWYDVMANNKLTAVFGTSASTPVFAAFVSLVNAKRLAAGKSSLGWINPSLYALYESFILNDITVGENNCVADVALCCEQGFTAVAGWDPVTGLGSVNYGKFEEAFFALGSIPTSGEPTVAPNLAPTMSPTYTVTTAPTVAAGWIYVNDYPSEECEGTPVSVIGVATGQCSISYGQNGEPNGSVRYSCGEAVATVYRYSDSACQTYLIGHNYFLGCATEIQDSYALITYAQSLECISNHNILPLPLTGNFALQSNYNGAKCNTATASFVGTLTGHCFNYGTSGTGLSFKYESDPLVQNVYRGTNCKTLYQTINLLQDECLAVAYEPQTDDYLGYTFGTNTLSTAMTYVTTTYNYQFTVTQTLNGISITAYNNNLNANNQAVTAAVSASMTGVTVENILITSVGAASSSASVVAALRRALQSTTDTTVVYTVNYDYIALGYTSNTAAYNALTSELTTAITSNAFTNSLNTYATSNGVNDMTAVTSNAAPVVSNYTSLLVNDDLVAGGGDDDSTDNTVAIACGTVFGILGLLCICGACFYCSRGRHSSGGEASKNAPMSAQAHNNTVPVVQAHHVQNAEPIRSDQVNKL